MSTTETSEAHAARVGPVQIGVLLLALATAGIHLYVFLIEGFLGDGTMAPIFQLLFVGNFLAYITLAVVLYFVAPLARLRPLVRVAIFSIALASIVSYYYVNVRDTVGEADKIIEILLMVLLTVDAVIYGIRGEIPGGGGGARGAAVGFAQLGIGVVAGYVMFLLLSPFLS